MNNAELKRKASNLLSHYMRMGFEANEKYFWTNDNESEMEEIVELIVQAAIEELKGRIIENEIKIR